MSAEAPISHEAVIVREPEDQVVPEREKLDLVQTMVIAGPSNAGKTELIRILQERYGWPVFDGSNSGFQRRGEKTTLGPLKKSREKHEEFDAKQALNFRKLKPEDMHTLHQTRLGGIILAEEKDRRGKEIREIRLENQWRAQKNKNPRTVPGQIPAISVLLWAKKDVRINRAYESKYREWEVDAEQATAEGKPLPPKPAKADIVSQMDRKEASDVMIWSRIHRRYVKRGGNPFSRTLARENGGPVYDRWIDTTNLNPEQVADEFVKIGLATSAVRFHVTDRFDQENKNIPTDESIEGRDPKTSLHPSF